MSGLRMSAKVLAVAASLAGIATALGGLSSARAQEAAVLFRNIRIFDGKGSALSAPSSVLVRKGVIEKISTADIPSASQVIDGGEQIVVADIAGKRGHRRRPHQHRVPMRIDQSRHQHAPAAVDDLRGARNVRG